MRLLLIDFLDPKKQKEHALRLKIGYVVIGLIVLLATTLLLYQAYGYGFDRHGRIIQNGLVFISSTPDGSEIYVNGEKKDTTSARLTLPAGQYVFELKREGYRTWKRAITVEGGTVQRFDYPFLFASDLALSKVKEYRLPPELFSQSLDRRWLVVQTETENVFDLFDLNASTPTPQLMRIPDEILSAGTTTLGWEAVEWADDNRRLVLRRHFDRGGQRSSEFILADREKPAESRNLSVILGFTPTVLELRDQAFDQYYAYDQQNRSLFTASLKKPTPQMYQSDVLAFESESDNMVLYATNKDAPPGKTLIRLREGDTSYTLRQVASDAAPYLLDLARFEDAWIVVAGASAENKVYVYKNPLDTLKKEPKEVAVPVHILKIAGANYLSFAPDNRFVMTENNDQFGLYDAKTNRGYAYQLKVPVDGSLGHATWMDGFRLNVLSGSAVVAFDYDGTNQQTLITASPKHTPYYDQDYKKLYTLNAQALLMGTTLRTKNDQ